jgi:hypothetical protein
MVSSRLDSSSPEPIRVELPALMIDGRRIESKRRSRAGPDRDPARKRANNAGRDSFTRAIDGHDVDATGQIRCERLGRRAQRQLDPLDRDRGYLEARRVAADQEVGQAAEHTTDDEDGQNDHDHLAHAGSPDRPLGRAQVAIRHGSE